MTAVVASFIISTTNNRKVIFDMVATHKNASGIDAIGTDTGVVGVNISVISISPNITIFSRERMGETSRGEKIVIVVLLVVLVVPMFLFLKTVFGKGGLVPMTMAMIVLFLLLLSFLRAA